VKLRFPPTGHPALLMCDTEELGSLSNTFALGGGSTLLDCESLAHYGRHHSGGSPTKGGPESGVRNSAKQRNGKALATGGVAAEDVRGAYRLIGECRDLGSIRPCGIPICSRACAGLIGPSQILVENDGPVVHGVGDELPPSAGAERARQVLRSRQSRMTPSGNEPADHRLGV